MQKGRQQSGTLQVAHVVRNLGGYSLWRVNCETAGLSAGSLLQVSGGQTRMEIIDVGAGPFN